MKRMLCAAVLCLMAGLSVAGERQFFSVPDPIAKPADVLDRSNLEQRNRELSRRVDDLLAAAAQSQIAETEATQARFFADELTRERDALRDRVKELESKLASNGGDAFNIAGLSTIKPSGRPVQWVVTSSPRCRPCQAWKRQAKARLPGYLINESPDAHFRIVELTDEQWARAGFSLPRAELIVQGQTVTTLSGGEMDHVAMAKAYVEYEAAAASTEQAYGIGVGSLPVKAQVSAMLDALKPFLDGGTLRVEYKPKAGVVREWLTIRQGSAGVKIPATTAVVFGFEGNQFVGRFEGTAPRVLLGPFERSPTAVEISPERIAVRLPWCPDPEISLK